MGALTLLFTFPAPIIFAVLLNELRGKTYKKVVQTVSYIPPFHIGGGYLFHAERVRFHLGAVQ